MSPASFMALLGLSLHLQPAPAQTVAAPDSVLLRFSTSPSVALLEIRRLSGPLIVRETPCHIRVSGKERIDFSLTLPGFYTERGRIDLRSAPPDTTIGVRLVPDSEVELQIVCDPPGAEIAVRDSSGEVIHQSRERATLWLRRQMVQLAAQWDGGKSRISWKDLREASGRIYEVVMTPDVKEVVLDIRSYPPATILLRPVSSASPLRAYGSLAAKVDKEIVVLICTWPDGETQTETINLRLVSGAGFHSAIWKQAGRVPVRLQAPRQDTAITVESADGKEQFTVQGGFLGTLRPVPYTISMATGSPQEGTETLMVDPSTLPPGDTLQIVLGHPDQE